MEEKDMRLLKQLSKQYPTIAAASTEIINLQSILNLPNGTEHFLTDIHGEYEQFNHVLKMVPVLFDARLMRNLVILCGRRIKKRWLP